MPKQLPPHPRIMLNDTALQALVGVINNDATAASYYAQVLDSATAALLEPVMANTNCTVVGACRGPWFNGYISVTSMAGRVLSLAMVHRVEAMNASRSPALTSKWSDRCVTELLSAAALPSWQWPVGQALEHSTVTFAMGVGYDWLYPALTAAQKAAVVNATFVLGLHTHAHSYHQEYWWTRDIYNWALVSNGGVVAAALAIGDEAAVYATANEVYGKSLASMARAMVSWAPAGVWPEGPSYLGYALEYVVRAAASMVTAVGNDNGLLASPGMEQLGKYAVAIHGPSQLIFNFADAHESTISPTPLLYVAKTHGDKALAAFSRNLLASGAASAAAETLIHYTAIGSNADIAALPLSRVWTDPSTDPSYGRKTHNHFDDHGSDSHNNHGHLDVGQFVLETKGVRWAVDVGPGAYDFPLLSYFGRFRFGYYDTTSFGHNTLQFDGESQSRLGSGAITGPVTNATDPSATVNMTAAYAAGGAADVSRTLSFSRNFTRFTVSDAWTHTRTGINVTWVMHTYATATVSTADPSTAVLRQDGQSVTARIASPAATAWRAFDLDLAFPQNNTVRGKQIRVVTASVPVAANGIVVVIE